MVYKKFKKFYKCEQNDENLEEFNNNNIIKFNMKDNVSDNSIETSSNQKDYISIEKNIKKSEESFQQNNYEKINNTNDYLFLNYKGNEFEFFISNIKKDLTERNIIPYSQKSIESYQSQYFLLLSLGFILFDFKISNLEKFNCSFLYGLFDIRIALAMKHLLNLKSIYFIKVFDHHDPYNLNISTDLKSYVSPSFYNHINKYYVEVSITSISNNNNSQIFYDIYNCIKFIFSQNRLF